MFQAPDLLLCYRHTGTNKERRNGSRSMRLLDVTAPCDALEVDVASNLNVAALVMRMRVAYSYIGSNIFLEQRKILTPPQS